MGKSNNNTGKCGKCSFRLTFARTRSMLYKEQLILTPRARSLRFLQFSLVSFLIRSLWKFKILLDNFLAVLKMTTL